MPVVIALCLVDCPYSDACGEFFRSFDSRFQSVAIKQSEKEIVKQLLGHTTFPMIYYSNTKPAEHKWKQWIPILQRRSYYIGGWDRFTRDVIQQAQRKI